MSFLKPGEVTSTVKFIVGYTYLSFVDSTKIFIGALTICTVPCMRARGHAVKLHLRNKGPSGLCANITDVCSIIVTP